MRLTICLQYILSYQDLNEGEENVCLPSGREIVQPVYLLKEKALSSDPTRQEMIIACCSRAEELYGFLQCAPGADWQRSSSNSPTKEKYAILWENNVIALPAQWYSTNRMFRICTEKELNTQAQGLMACNYPLNNLDQVSFIETPTFIGTE